MNKNEIMATKKADAKYGERYISKKFDPSKHYNCFEYYDVSNIKNIWKYAYNDGDILRDGDGNFYKVLTKKIW